MIGDFIQHTNGSERGKWIALERPKLVLGRQEGCDLVVEPEFTSVSRRHAVLRWKDEKWVICDVGSEGTGSTYGTYVNGEKLEPTNERSLEPGDVIRLGSQTGKIFVFNNKTTAPERLAVGLVVDTAKHQLVLQGQPLSVHLSPQELDLLHGIWEKRGKVCTFAEICDRLWPDEESHSGRQDDVHQVIRQVRKKLETVLDTEVIENVPRVGYRFGG